MQNSAGSLKNQEAVSLLEMLQYLIEREAEAAPAGDVPWAGMALTVDRCLRLLKKQPAQREVDGPDTTDTNSVYADIMAPDLRAGRPQSVAARLRKLPPLGS